MQKRKALITGITGQDGSFLAELLLAKDYEVYGIVRRSSSFNRGRIDHLHQPSEISGLRLIYGHMNDSSSLNKALRTVKPDEIPTINFEGLIHIMVDADLADLQANNKFPDPSAGELEYQRAAR